MEFKEKYTALAEKDKIENKDKIVISNEAYALGELLEQIFNKLEHLRLSNFK